MAQKTRSIHSFTFTIQKKPQFLKFYKFYDLPVTKTKLKLLLLARKYKQLYVRLCFIWCAQNPDNGR
jgi:hypothetical protein